jgi:hypothetical protein
MTFEPVNLTEHTEALDDPRRPLLILTQGKPNQAWETEFNKTSWEIPSLVQTPPTIIERGIAVPDSISGEGLNAISQAVNRANDVAKAADVPSPAERYKTWFALTHPDT